MLLDPSERLVHAIAVLQSRGGHHLLALLALCHLMLMLMLFVFLLAHAHAHALLHLCLVARRSGSHARSSSSHLVRVRNFLSNARSARNLLSHARSGSHACTGSSIGFGPTARTDSVAAQLEHRDRVSQLCCLVHSIAQSIISALRCPHGVFLLLPCFLHEFCIVLQMSFEFKQLWDEPRINFNISGSAVPPSLLQLPLVAVVDSSVVRSESQQSLKPLSLKGQVSVTPTFAAPLTAALPFLLTYARRPWPKLRVRVGHCVIFLDELEVYFYRTRK